MEQEKYDFCAGGGERRNGTRARSGTEERKSEDNCIGGALPLGGGMRLRLRQAREKKKQKKKRRCSAVPREEINEKIRTLIELASEVLEGTLKETMWYMVQIGGLFERKLRNTRDGTGDEEKYPSGLACFLGRAKSPGL